MKKSALQPEIMNTPIGGTTREIRESVPRCIPCWVLLLELQHAISWGRTYDGDENDEKG